MHVRSGFSVLTILLGKDSPRPKKDLVKIHHSQNLYTSRFDIEIFDDP